MPNKAPPTSPPRVYQTLEDTAGTFPPWVYDLLTFQRANWTTTPDELDGQFLPLTTAGQRSSRDAKLFVIGLIPPSATVTGRLLDRSATLASVQGFAEEVDVNGTVGNGSTPGGTSTAGGPAVTTTPPAKIFTVPGYQFAPANGPPTVGTPIQPGAVGPDMGSPVITSHSSAEMYHIFHDAYVRVFGKEPTPTEVLFLVVQSNRETSGRWPNNNPGFIGNFKKAQPGTFLWRNGKYFLTFSSTEAGADYYVKTAFRNPNTRAAAASGDVIGYITSLAQSNYYGEPANVYYAPFPALLKEAAAAIAAAGGPTWNINGLPPSGPDACAFKEDMVSYRLRTGWTERRLAGKEKPPPEVLAVNPNGRFLTLDAAYGPGCPLTGSAPSAEPNGQALDWGTTGGKAAVQAQKAQEKLADKDLNQTDLGKILTTNQEAYIRALQIAIQQMAQTPPLKLLVNPITFKPAEEKIISDGNFGRYGPIVEHWGEQQTKITASGKLAGFFALDVGTTVNGSAGNGPGLTRMARSFSASYQNFLSLYLIYRNNGTVWIEDLHKSQPKTNNLAVVGSVYLYYDNVLYIGSFDTFNVNETDDKPYTLEYDFTFTVRYKFELDRIPDPREYYGNSSVFAQKLSPQPIQTDTSQSQPKPTTSRPLTDVDRAFLEKAREPVDPSVKSRFVFGDAPVTEESIGLSRPAVGGNPEIIPSRLAVPGTSTKKR